MLETLINPVNIFENVIHDWIQPFESFMNFFFHMCNEFFLVNTWRGSMPEFQIFRNPRSVFFHPDKSNPRNSAIWRLEIVSRARIFSYSKNSALDTWCSRRGKCFFFFLFDASCPCGWNEWRFNEKWFCKVSSRKIEEFVKPLRIFLLFRTENMDSFVKASWREIILKTQSPSDFPTNEKIIKLWSIATNSCRLIECARFFLSRSSINSLLLGINVIFWLVRSFGNREQPVRDEKIRFIFGEFDLSVWSGED